MVDTPGRPDLGPSRSLATKIMLLAVVTSGVGVVLVCAALTVSYVREARDDAVVRTTTQADILAVHSAAPLTFDDPEAGEETLAALAADPATVAACLYDAEGRPFAWYNATPSVAKLPGRSPVPGHVWREGDLLLTRAVTMSDNELGTLALVSDMDALDSLIRRRLGAAAVIGAVAVIVSVLLAWRLSRLIVRPVHALGDTAQIVSRTGDYGVRAAKYTNDELGQLTEAFNHMLDQIQARDAELEQRNEEMEQFVYTASHDLKSPLVTIQGFVGHLRQDLGDGRHDRLDRFAGRVEEAARRMRRNIDDLLELSRIGRISSDPVAVDAAELTRSVVADHEAEISERGVVIEINEPLPTLFVDPDRLRQVIDNLLTNALKYGCNEEASRIEIGGRETDREQELSIRDHGAGIEPRYHDRIFRLFERLDTERDGTGVGLAIVKRIVELHGGRVWVESASGAGTTFFIRFPRRSALSAAA
ncbi:MAG: HAMP domain-containing protein [Phycisphaerales bacterium]|nr:HAMP domain-containing protein [Phycisphaerae bacterium]NNF44134.1 HAMP domain-containing protein [Phycisphaerales bacterium]NNM26341.1 HAMP domain-containing protein [Phycisphaerales bacterium]